MQNIINSLCTLAGRHSEVAILLGYTDRQYRNIRNKVAQGEELPPRIAELIRMKLQELQALAEVENDSRS